MGNHIKTPNTAETSQDNYRWTTLSKTFFKIGAFNLGGGYAMIPIIETEVVEKHPWIEKDEFLDLIAVAQSLSLIHICSRFSTSLIGSGW